MSCGCPSTVLWMSCGCPCTDQIWPITCGPSWFCVILDLLTPDYPTSSTHWVRDWRAVGPAPAPPPYSGQPGLIWLRALQGNVQGGGYLNDLLETQIQWGPSTCNWVRGTGSTVNKQAAASSSSSSSSQGKWCLMAEAWCKGFPPKDERMPFNSCW